MVSSKAVGGRVPHRAPKRIHASVKETVTSSPVSPASAPRDTNTGSPTVKAREQVIADVPNGDRPPAAADRPVFAPGGRYVPGATPLPPGVAYERREEVKK